MDKREPSDFKILFENLPGLYLILRPDLTIAAATQAYAQATMISVEKILGRHLFEVFPDNPEDPHATGTSNLRDSLQRVLTEKTADTMAIQKYDIRRPDSEGGGFQERHWSPVNSPILGPDGSVAYIVHRVEDVTEFMRVKERGSEQASRAERMEVEVISRARELQDANKKLQRLDAMRTRFFANVSHELRTPLTLILAPVRRILAEGKTDSGIASDLQGVVNNARLLLKHVDDLLEVAKLEAGRMELRYSEFDLSGLIRMIASNFASFAQDKGYRFSVSAPEILSIQADPEKVQRILINLLSNAFKFTPVGGWVHCELAVGGEGTASPDDAAGVAAAVIMVKDSGPGIPARLRETIFDRFYRVEQGPTRRSGGTGLGLSIVKELIGLHRGSVSVEGGPGEGATFRITLPLRAPRGAEVQGEGGDAIQTVDTGPLYQLVAQDPDPTAFQPPAEEAADPARPRLLIVEDNPEMRELLIRTLVGKFRVVTARNGSEGFLAAERSNPDLILSDLMMPETSGADLLRMIRAQARFDDTPFILLTAKADEESRVSLLEAGAQDYIEKPFVAEEVRARVGNLVAMKKAREALRKAKDAAEAANQELDAFAHSVSHDLRTPLRHVQGFSELLRQRIASGPDETARGLLDEVLQACLKMSALIDDVLSFSRMSRSELRQDQVDMRRLAEESIRDLAPETAGRPIQWTVAELPDATGDRAMLKQVFLNLLSNALKFTRPRDPALIEVGFRKDDGGIVYWVKDNGAGFDMEYADKLFGVFQRLHSGSEFEGTGIGLANVRRILNRHGGKTWGEGAPGKGAAFYFRLPMAEA